MEKLQNQISKQFEDFETSNKHRIGLVYLFAQAFLFSINHPLAKFSTLDSFQIVQYRAILMLLLNYFLLKKRNIPQYYKNTQANRKLILRGLVGSINMNLLFFAIKNMSLSEAITIIYTMPIFSIIFGAIFFKEGFGLNEVLGSICGLTGVVFMFKPKFLQDIIGFEILNSNEENTQFDPFRETIARYCSLASAICSSLVFIILRSFKQGYQVDGQAVIQYFNIVQAFLCPLLMIFSNEIVTPTILDIILILFITISAYLGQFLLQRGLKMEKVGKSAVCNYTLVLYCFIYDVFLFGYSVDLFSSIGMGLIGCSAIFIFLRNWFQK